MKASSGIFTLSRSNTPLADPSITPTQATPVKPGHLEPAASTGRQSLIGALTKRSVSATGISRRSSAREPADRVASEAGASRTKAASHERRQASSTGLVNGNIEGQQHPTGAAKGLMALLHPSRGSSTPVPSPLPSPIISSTPILGSINGAIDGTSHVSRVASRMSELINKILPAANTAESAGQAILRGRCSARADRAREFGDYLYSELMLAANDHYLLRSLLRSATSKSISVLLSRMEGLVTTASGDPSTCHIPRSTKDVLSPAQRFNFDNVRAIAEIRTALAKATTADKLPSFAQDALIPWLAKFDALIGQIVNPSLAEAKRLTGLIIARARDTFQRSASHTALGAQTTATAPSAFVDIVQGRPAYLVELAQMLEAVVAMINSFNCGPEAHKWIVGIASHLAWKGMLAFAARPCPTLSEDEEHSHRPSPNPTVRKTTASRSRAALPLLRNTGIRRSPSPPLSGSAEVTNRDDAIIKEVAAFNALVALFVDSVYPTKFKFTLAREEALNKAKTIAELCEAFDLLPELDSDDEGDDLVHEAMHEALLALGSFELAIRALKWPEEIKLAFLYDDDDSSSSSEDEGSRLTPSVAFNLVGPASPATRVAAEKAKRSPVKIITPVKLPNPTLDRALDTMPPLITFHLLASRLPSTRCHAFRLPHEIWQLADQWDQYAGQLIGFSSGDAFAEEVGWQMVSELDRIKTDEMGKRDGRSSEGTWEALLRIAVQAEVGEG